MHASTVPSIQSLPLEGVDEDGRWRFSQDDDSVREVIRNILLTRPGERLRRDRFGAGLLDFIHQPNNVTTRNLMAGVVHKSITQWEPRIQVEQVQVLPDEQELATVHIVIRYHMRHLDKSQQLSLSLALNQL